MIVIVAYKRRRTHIFKFVKVNLSILVLISLINKLEKMGNKRGLDLF
jgi:hypothetical protein